MNYNQLQDFISFAQNFHAAVKFTYEICEESIAFLDMDITLKTGQTDNFGSQTDNFGLLQLKRPTLTLTYYHSSHNSSPKNSIPYFKFLYVEV